MIKHLLKSRYLTVPVLILAFVMISSMAQADYVAYAINKKGEETPMPENGKAIVKKNAKKVVGLRWGEYAGKRIRIGVMEADNKSGAASYHYSGPGGEASYSSGYEQVPVNGIDALLTDALTKTGRFRVLTRTELNEVLDEQDLGDSGRVAKPSAAKIGKVLGAQYLVQVVVNSYEANVGGKKAGLGGFSRKLKAFGGVKGGKNKSYVQLTFKLIDAETSEIMASEVVEGTITELSLDMSGVGWGGAGALGGFLSGYSKTPIGQAVMAVINIGVFELVKQVGNLPMTGTVVKVEDSRVIVNLGADAVQTGDELKAVSQGEEFVDPETGLSLGADEEDIGILKVTDVKEKYCYAVPLGFETSRLSRGDKVLSSNPPAPLTYGPAWK